MFPFFLSKKKTVTLTFKNHFLFFCLGVVFVLHWFTFFTGVQKATASLGTLAFSTFPFFLTFLEPLFYKLPFSFYKILLCIFIMIGVYFLIPQFSLTSSHFVGICWGILSGFFMALAILWSRFLSLKFPIVVIVLSFLALFFAFPYWIVEIWAFVLPGLYRKERKVFWAFVPATFLFFIGGASFGYFIVFPFRV